MPLREIVGKSVAFGLVGAALIGGGILVLLGAHAYNDYFNTALAVLLFLIGLGVWGMGTLVILGAILTARRARREHELRITPRPGPLGPPPPWGMGEVGRPGSGVIRVGEQSPPSGGGGPRVMSVALGTLDVPLVIIGLVVWTVLFLVLLSPR